MASFGGFEDVEEPESSKERLGLSNVKSKRNPKTKRSKGPDSSSKNKIFHPIPDEARLSEISMINDSQLNPDILKNIHDAKQSERAFESDPELKSQTLSETVESMSKLDEIKMRREQIERENKQKQELLAQTIAARRKQTTSETEKLRQVQNELLSIDQELSVDVKHLMNTIQKSSIEFAEAEKRYARAEAEFVQAKLNLQVKTEKKELLMEHLSLIIEQNEMRKAERLSRIMEELGLC